MTTLNLTLEAVQAAYDNGQTPRQLMAAIREQAESLSDRAIFITLLSESEQAPFLDALQKLNRVECPLWGVPFVIKDNIDLAGISTTAACEAFSYTPTETAQVVQRLLAAGAIPVGKANLDQFATGLNGTRSPWGACRNSFDPDYVSGGSSAGSAVAVAMGLATFSLGTDTAGSGRIPACFNNLVGVKPTRGMLPVSGVVPACKTLDCVSIFCLHCDDANDILAIAEGLDDSDAFSRPSPVINNARHYGKQSGPLRLAVLADEDLRFFGDNEYLACYQSTLKQLSEDGVELITIDYTPFDETARLLYEGPWVSERYLATLPLIEQQPNAIFPAVRGIIEGGAKPKATELFRAQYRLQALQKVCHAQLESVDALLTPTAGRHFTIQEMLDEPVKRNSELGYYMNFVNLLDLAAVSAPTAMTSSGRPFGVTLSSVAFSDRRLLSIASRLQQLFKMPLGATNFPLPPMISEKDSSLAWMNIVVCGAHMQGMPLNHQLTERCGTFIMRGQTAPEYRLYALAESPVQRPALVKTSTGGVSIDVEVWKMPCTEFGSFLAGIAAPLGLGKVTLSDGNVHCGFIAEATAVEGAEDASAFGGWRAYLDRQTDA